MQLEAKIETERHNMKIKMDKDLVVLQKQINLLSFSVVFLISDIHQMSDMYYPESDMKCQISETLSEICKQHFRVRI